MDIYWSITAENLKPIRHSTKISTTSDHQRSALKRPSVSNYNLRNGKLIVRESTNGEMVVIAYEMAGFEELEIESV